jgi:hypothetical protein
VPKRKEPRGRKVKATLETSAAKPATERVLALGADGRLAGYGTGAYVPSGAPGSWGGSSTPDATGQIGTPGNLNVFGYLTGEDYNPDLDGFAMFANYNKMRLSDAQVNATLLMLKLPLKGATWVVKPASDDPQDVAIADFVQANLIDDDALDRSWQHVLDNAMLKFDFGCSAEEIVWALSPGTADTNLARVHQLVELARTGRTLDLATVGDNEGPVYAKVKDLAPRLPRTFYRWIEDVKTGRLAYLQQYAPKNGQYGYWNIPADRLALHVRGREGNSYYGRSTLRTAYPHWWWKQQLYRIDMIGHDRFHVGIPRAKLTQDYQASVAPLDKIEQTLKGLRSHDRAYMVQPFGVEYDVFAMQTGQGTSTLVDSLEHHNLMIARNILQSFSAQGEQRHGSFGAAKVTSDVYFDALLGEANEIGSELKQAVVKRLCDMNFNMGGRKYPSLLCTNIATVDFDQLAEAFSKLTTAKIVTPDDDLEEWFRDLADAPQLPEDMKGQDRTPASVATPFGAPSAPAGKAGTGKVKKNPDETIAAAKRTPYLEQGRSFGRQPTALERKVLDLHGLPAALDQARDHLVGQLATIRRRQLSTVAARIAQKDGRDTAPFTDFRHRHIKMPEVSALTKAIRVAQDAALAYGQQSVHDELQRQGVKLSTSLADNPTSAKNLRTAKSTLVSSAQITARKQSETWLARTMDEGLRLRRTGLQGTSLKQRIVENLDDEAESGARRDAAAEIHEAFGIGRAYAATEFSGHIEFAEYSAILDANTCDPCQELDGEEFEVDSEEYFDALPPYKDCDGRDNCRCVMIFVAKEVSV